MKYTHIVVQSLPLFITRTFSSSQTEALYPLKTNSPSPLPSFPGNLYLLSISVNLPILGTAYKWNHIIFVHLCLTYLN